MFSSHYKLNKTKDLLGLRILWLCFSLFILYGTLIPLNLRLSSESILSNISNISWIPFIDPDGSRASIPDVTQNILLFLPFGAIGFLSNSNRNMFYIIAVTFLGFLLSLSVEVLQLVTIDRTTSVTDLMTNTVGTFLGALSAYTVINSFSTFIL